MLSLDAKFQTFGMYCCSNVTTKSLSNSSITQSVHHIAIKKEDTSQDEDNEMED